jgi:chromosome segregation ATPase
MSKQTVQSLEVDLTELTKKLESIKRERSVAASLLKSGNQDIENYKKSLEHHRQNIVHMKGPADIVNLEEFIKTKQLYFEVKDNLTITKQQVSQAGKVLVKMDAAIITFTAELKAVRKALEGYGRVENFPIKDLS